MAPIEYFDSHCHLDPMRYGGDTKDVLQRARAAGVSRMTVIGTRAADSEAAVQLSEHEEGVFCAVGIHPKEVDDVDETVEHVKQENIPVWREPFSIGHSPERMAIVGDSEGNAIGIMSF